MKLHITDYILSPFILLILVAAYVVIGAVCWAWPAMETALGLRCHLCECRDYAAAHPVPLPSNADMLRDLASIGVPGAAEKLNEMGLHHVGRVSGMKGKSGSEQH